MPGNKSNVRRFNRIDVHVAEYPATRAELKALLPEDYATHLPAAYTRAGLLAPDGFTLARDEASQNINAYGVDGLVESIDTFNFESWAAIFLEDNPVVQELVYPGSTATTGGTLIKTPAYKKQITCFTLENTATGYGERWITIGGSIWRVNGDRATPDSDIRRTPLIATVFALDEDDTENAVLGDGGLYFKQSTEDSTGGE